MIALARCAEEHRGLLHGWRNTPDVARFMHHDEPIPAAAHNRWYAALLADDRRRAWVVTVDDEPVGAAFLTDHDERNRRASFGLYVAEPARRGAGVGRAALCLVCEYAFDEWQLHKLIGEALSFNTAAIALYARLGFTEEGILRDHLCRDGRWVDVRAMALFEDGLEPVRATLAQLRSQGRVA